MDLNSLCDDLMDMKLKMDAYKPKAVGFTVSDKTLHYLEKYAMDVNPMSPDNVFGGIPVAVDHELDDEVRLWNDSKAFQAELIRLCIRDHGIEEALRVYGKDKIVAYFDVKDNLPGGFSSSFDQILDHSKAASYF